MRAETAGQNLVTNKYGYMMETTDPEGYARIKGALPEISAQKQELAERIGEVHLRWAEDCARKYPTMASTGRPVYTREDTLERTSSQTYLRGELYTYSEATLSSYLAYVQRTQADGGNLCENILDYTARAYGYESAAEYERLRGAKGGAL